MKREKEGEVEWNTVQYVFGVAGELTMAFDSKDGNCLKEGPFPISISAAQDRPK